ELFLERVKSQPARKASRKDKLVSAGLLHTSHLFNTRFAGGAVIILSLFCNSFALAIRRSLFQSLAMQSYELLREVLKSKPPKQVAEDIGLSVSVLYKWAEPPEHAAGSGIGNPLDRVEALLQSTGDHRIAQWICQRAN